MKTTSTNTMNTLRIVARVMRALIVGFALLMFIGEAIQSNKRGNGEPMTMDMIIGLTLAGMGLLGLALAWKWEMAGGLVNLQGI
jgi:RsiW-degrading membrane proteinase PrsW (M82 family)